jgi:hypothetical protein
MGITSTKKTKPTFDELMALEPRLGVLLREAKAHQQRKGFCANAVWYGYDGSGGLKGRLLMLVGWERRPRHEVLNTQEAYDVAYETIYRALPDCNHGEGLFC